MILESDYDIFHSGNEFDDVVCKIAAVMSWAHLPSHARGKLFDAQPTTGQVTEVTRSVIGRAQPRLLPSKRQKTDPGLQVNTGPNGALSPYS